MPHPDNAKIGHPAPTLDTVPRIEIPTLGDESCGEEGWASQIRWAAPPPHRPTSKMKDRQVRANSRMRAGLSPMHNAAPIPRAPKRNRSGEPTSKRPISVVVEGLSPTCNADRERRRPKYPTAPRPRPNSVTPANARTRAGYGVPDTHEQSSGIAKPYPQRQARTRNVPIILLPAQKRKHRIYANARARVAHGVPQAYERPPGTPKPRTPRREPRQRQSAHPPRPNAARSRASKFDASGEKTGEPMGGDVGSVVVKGLSRIGTRK
ncbi:hypothetical protein B0H16DRAFT_1763963 [Mycena metata]|uniref:Uncharacterized protein n=1 Tax=Mycena metata TaxID=1033252 RepID=A0AAD7I6W3_9AGAR|nr:hypothetical protein B0H16DRAFT_1763963 [Mycena metata]